MRFARAAMLAAALTGVLAAPAPAATRTGSVTDGKARFQVLSPTLIRLECSDDREFEDGRTLTVASRRARTRFTTAVRRGVRVIRTGRMTLRHRRGRCFEPGSLTAHVRVGKRFVKVKPAFGDGPGEPPPPPNPPTRTHAPPNPDPNPAPRTRGNLGGWARGLDDQEDPVPLADGLISRDGWYLLDDSRSALVTGAGPEERPGHDGTYQDGYLFGYGLDYARGLADLRRLTGAAPLLPRRAFGNWFSRWFPYGAADFQQIVERFRAEQVPLDVLGLDTDFKAPTGRASNVANVYLGRDPDAPYSWNGWDWNRELYPDPKGFVDWLHARGIATYLNVHPSISDRDPRFAEAQQRSGGLPFANRVSCGYFMADPGECGVFDWTNAHHLDAYWALHEPFERDGIDFWWLDWCCDESSARLPGLTEDTWINSLYARRSRDRGSRWPSFSRIGSSYWSYFGEQEPGAFAEHRHSIHFTGDTAATWQMLDFQSRFTVAEGNIGLPYVSHDIGSFKGKHLADDMYVRWIQAGAFGPINRLHSNHGDRLPWEYGGEAARIAAEFLRLRGTLVPLLYTLAREAHDTGVPIVRGTYLRWPKRDDAYAHDRQYLLGDDLLVAPVGAPGDPATKRVWFPPGEWVDFFTGERHRGPAVKELSVPLARMPVFARAGSVLVRQPFRHNEAEGTPRRLQLDVQAGADGAFRLYEDAGDGLAYRRGAHAFTRISHDDRGAAGAVVRIGAARGSFPGRLGRRGWDVRLAGIDRPGTVTIDRRATTEWTYDEATRTVTVATPRLPTSRTARIELRP
ncbi:MAG: DUF5110 domain-containing protein [Actinomycetota bacterium]|nr:DUF5110 domain-containing protein [Actinomycetota bacterium]